MSKRNTLKPRVKLHSNLSLKLASLYSFYALKKYLFAIQPLHVQENAKIKENAIFRCAVSMQVAFFTCITFQNVEISFKTLN